jgi:D-glycero-D-manno-heptose 1,7-bisphosphate phosphatase
VFLDRDGVLNEAYVRAGVPTPPHDRSEFQLLPGVATACADLHAAGYVLVVITNQPDIARGTRTRAQVDDLNDRLRELVPELDEVIVCPHDDSDDCSCRKPEPGMIVQAAQRLGLDLSRSVCVGDRWRDIEAAQRACVWSIRIRWDSGDMKTVEADVTVASLAAAVPHIQAHIERGTGTATLPNPTEAGQSYRIGGRDR